MRGDPTIEPLDDIQYACSRCGVGVWDVDAHLAWHRSRRPLRRLRAALADLWNWARNR